jgi:hypothetical protein
MSDANFVLPGGPATPPVLPVLVPGLYELPISTGVNATSATLGNGTMRVCPWYVPQSIRIDRIGGDVTVIGDVSSVVRFGIWLDNGNGFPRALYLDGGTIAGDVVAVANGSGLSSSLLIPSGIVWIGGGPQLAPGTQPTIRTTGSWTPPIPIASSVIPSSGTNIIGYSTSMAGALTDWPQGVYNGAGNSPRCHVRIA